MSKATKTGQSAADVLRRIGTLAHPERQAARIGTSGRADRNGDSYPLKEVYTKIHRNIPKPLSQFPAPARLLQFEKEDPTDPVRSGHPSRLRRSATPEALRGLAATERKDIRLRRLESTPDTALDRRDAVAGIGEVFPAGAHQRHQLVDIKNARGCYD